MAEEVLGRYGADVADARRGHGWTNRTWLTDDLVVRVAPRPEPADLLREERLLRLLPPEVGCPVIVESGVSGGHEWVLTRRVPGENLEEVWPSLDGAARSRAVEQMWERVRHVHRVDPAAAAPHARSRSPFFAEDAAAATAALSRVVAAGGLDDAEARGLARVLDCFWAALPAAPRVLNHGDFCAPNTLWHDGQVVALLDFEFAVVAPSAVDLNELVKIGYGPGDDDRAPLRAVIRRIATAELPGAGGPDVLLGHSVMLEMWVLENELTAEDPDENDLAQATAMLRAFAEGDGGYYAPLLADTRH
ncbi:phosphotransferase family protein [Streptomyces aureocirculatus]|uniref:phosphotransferase family protein n=1 Tax=Streptomyces aureocirculatus TaxID=67275 RepID=UPI000A6B9CE8|nr:aminoglycoside phosphotransferase family protein [Streptomyces aureocirculatus]